MGCESTGDLGKRGSCLSWMTPLPWSNCAYPQQQQWQCWFWWKTILANQEQSLLQKVCC